MSDENPFLIGYRGRRCFPFRPGDVVRVKSGALVGAIGVVECVAEDLRCAISIIGAQSGVSIILDPDWLELADPLSS